MYYNLLIYHPHIHKLFYLEELSKKNTIRHTEKVKRESIKTHTKERDTFKQTESNITATTWGIMINMQN